ncbi:MAG: hypothetical protein V3U75_04260 [Methylococcaceae bacterium]
MPTDDLEHPKTNDDILRKVIQMRADGVAGSANFYDRMQKSEDFTIGGDLQWDPGVKEAARLDGKFTLTIPIVGAQIDQLSGAEIQNPMDFIIAPTKEGSATIARILTALTKQAADSEDVRYEKSQTFESGISSGQGCIGVFIDKTNDPKHANLRIEKLNEHNVIADPNASVYNINKKDKGAKYVIYEEWIDKELVHVEYPDEKEELEGRGNQSFFGAIAGNVIGIIDWMTGRRQQKETGTFGTRERTDVEVMSKSRYLKSHTWWREPKNCVHWFDRRESELESKFLHKDSEIAAAKKATKSSEEKAQRDKEKAIAFAVESKANMNDPKIKAIIEEAGIPIFSIEEVVCNIMHHTIRVGDTFLEDREDELNGVQMFPICFFWPKWVNGYKSGVSEKLIGVQEEINWTHSQALNIVKQIANTGVIIKDDPTGDYTDWLKEHLGTSGIVLNRQKAGGDIDFIDPPPFPTMEIFTQQAMQNANRITGISPVPEKDPKALSGRAKFLDRQKETQGTMSLNLNWNYTLAVLGDLIVDIIRKNDIFSEDEIREIVDKDDLLDEEIMDQARGVVISLFQKQGGNVPEQPQPPNPIRMSNTPAEQQAQMLDAFQEEQALFQSFVDQVDAAARPIAEEILIKLIHNMKSGEYSTKVTTSPMAETMRAIKAIEVFELQKVLRESGDVGLDGEDLIDATDVPRKEQLKQGRQKILAQVSQIA